MALFETQGPVLLLLLLLQGFDLALVDAVSKAVTIPVIASSGAGAPKHFTEVRDAATAQQKSIVHTHDDTLPALSGL
jgi:glutamine amidotransferase/cyclase